jgi:hypothetical protein
MLSGWGADEAQVSLTLYTDAFVITGSLPSRQRRISDILNFADDDFLVLNDAVLQGLGPGGERHAAANAQVNLAAVLFAVAADSVEPSAELRTPKVARATLISIPPFSVTGRIHLMPERDVRSALQELHGRFVPVTGATFWSDALGEARRTAPMIAVNHARAQILSPYGEEDAAPAPDGPPGNADADADAEDHA